MLVECSSEDLNRKLRRSLNEVCLNCHNYSNCENIAQYEECLDFIEIEDEVWIIERLDKN